MEIKSETTNRGFSLSRFIDRSGNECSLQKSSLAFEDAIWFGIDDPDPKIMASMAPFYGIDTGGETTGWVKYPIPGVVDINSRMHLTQEQVRELLPILQKFADTGDI